MHLSRIKITSFRNFANLDVKLSKNVVIVGENRVGKSNLLFALRLIFDPALPDSARELGLADFWDGLGEPSADDKIVVAVEIKDFEHDPDVLAVLTDYRIDGDPETVRLTYEFRPRADLEDTPSTEDDFEFICFGGESESKEFGHELRRRITMDLLPALRDAESDLAAWRRSPLRPLIEDAFRTVDLNELQEISDAIGEATDKITKFDQVRELEESIGTLFLEMSGPKQDVKPRLGLTPLDATKLYRSIKLLIDEGARGIGEASLGSANLIFLGLKALEIQRLIQENRRDHTLLAIEEPEAHLHPHLQRSVYRHLFEKVSEQEEEEESSLSVILTTHSPHIASVAPLRSIVLLKDTSEGGTMGRSTAGLLLRRSEEDDLARYLDVTRAEMLFARGVILVEGDAERFLIPEFAKALDKPLDFFGITICSVAGTNFQPYAKFLGALGIPFALVTDWDPQDEGKPLGYNRALRLVETIEEVRTGTAPAALIEELKALGDYNEFSDRCETFGVFTNRATLELDLFEDGLGPAMLAGLRDGRFSAAKVELINQWEAHPDQLDSDRFLAMIEAMGKGRFAQRLATRIADIDPPHYIAAAIRFVADRV